MPGYQRRTCNRGNPARTRLLNCLLYLPPELCSLHQARGTQITTLRYSWLSDKNQAHQRPEPEKHRINIMFGIHKGSLWNI
jgi:hypothetical protein